VEFHFYIVLTQILDRFSLDISEVGMRQRSGGRSRCNIHIGGNRTSGIIQGWSVRWLAVCVFTHGVRGSLGHGIVVGIGATLMRDARRSTNLCIMHACYHRSYSNSRHEMNTKRFTQRKRGNAIGV
jgi:hypothetical protein